MGSGEDHHLTSSLPPKLHAPLKGREVALFSFLRTSGVSYNRPYAHHAEAGSQARGQAIWWNLGLWNMSNTTLGIKWEFLFLGYKVCATAPATPPHPLSRHAKCAFIFDIGKVIKLAALLLLPRLLAPLGRPNQLLMGLLNRLIWEYSLCHSSPVPIDYYYYDYYFISLNS